jgi:ornithine cyclodeaminase/alanine dehydrogenase-like protein (mu-crystallin family)
MIDGTVATGLRTGAVSAVRARYLTNDSEIIAMIGVPLQARYEINTMLNVEWGS